SAEQPSRRQDCALCVRLGNVVVQALVSEARRDGRSAEQAGNTIRQPALALAALLLQLQLGLANAGALRALRPPANNLAGLLVAALDMQAAVLAMHLARFRAGIGHAETALHVVDVEHHSPPICTGSS